ncbi:MAG TPA: hypothetical protein VNJ52_00740 [Patescibacteria group bacterium]|nr:hypothetical protein [Patescibacteria group bacterium]
MARKGNAKLNAAAIRIGRTVGRADRGAREIGEKAQSTIDDLRRGLAELTKTADQLARDLKKAEKRLRRALR